MLSVVIQAKFRPNRDTLDDGRTERNGVDLEVFQNKMGKALPSPNPILTLIPSTFFCLFRNPRLLPDYEAKYDKAGQVSGAYLGLALRAIKYLRVV